jgi:hypothetical protein
MAPVSLRAGQPGTGFRQREKERVAQLRPALVSAVANADGEYAGAPRSFCLHEEHSGENLWAGVRQSALKYFSAREIPWHDGLRDSEGRSAGRPSNHLCCSQSSCVNALFVYREYPDLLAAALRDIGLPVAEVLPFDLDDAPGSPHGAVAFEWIGRRNYLSETSYGRVSADTARKRGKGFTSADFAVRYREQGGQIGLLLGEWKYTERYSSMFLRYATSKSKTDRLAIYKSALSAPWSQVSGVEDSEFDHLFFDPFLQLMRLQLLAGEMEHDGSTGRPEMEATKVSVLHVAPEANHDFMDRITSEGLKPRAKTVHGVWATVASPGRFHGVDLVVLLKALIEHSPCEKWAAYMSKRYLGMK